MDSPDQPRDVARPSVRRSVERLSGAPGVGSELRADPRSFDVPVGSPAPQPAVDDSGGDDGAPPPTPTEPPERRRRWPRIVAAVALVAVASTVALGGYGWWKFRSIDRIELDEVLSAPSAGTNYLIVGTDSRAGVDPDNPNAGVIFGAGNTGAGNEPLRSDTIVVLRVGDGPNKMMALPRDLLVPIAGTGSTQRINTAIQGGPERLVQTVQQSLGVEVHHYLEIDFAGFIDLVDSLGGVTIDFPHPAYDDKSGLRIDLPGPQNLDGDMALAYVRSRTYTEVIDGTTRRDGTADLGRVQRQQTFLRSVFEALSSTRNPLRVPSTIDAVADTVRFDDRLGFFDALGLMRRLRGLPETVILPTTPTTTSSGAAVLVLGPGAEAVLADFSEG